MSRKSRRGLIILSSLLTFAAVGGVLVGCDKAGYVPNKNGSSTLEVNSISIKNKEELQAEWHVADSDRLISIVCDPASINVADEIYNGNIKIVSSDSSVVAVRSSYLSAVGAGTAVIAVSAGGKTDTVTITVQARIEMETITVAEALAKSAGEVVAVKAKVVAVSSSGYFLADSTGMIYVYTALEGFSVGDSVNVQGALGTYGGIQQLTSTSYKIEASSTKVDYELTYEELDGTKINDLATNKTTQLTKSFGVSLTATLVASSANESGLKDGRYFFKVDGMDEGNILYSGYLTDEISTLILDEAKEETAESVLGKRFKIKAIFGGYGTHSGTASYSCRINLYPVEIEEVDRIAVSSVTISAEKTSLMQKETTKLSAEIGPVGSFGEVTYEITEGNSFVELSGNVVKGVAAGTAKIVAKVGNVTSEPISITVTDQVYEPITIEQAKKVENGKTVLVKAKYIETMKYSKTYGTFFGDGKQGLFVYGYDGESNGLTSGDVVTISGTVSTGDFGFQIQTGATVAKSTATDVAAPVVEAFTSSSDYTTTDGGKWVSIEGNPSADVVADSYGNAHFTLVTSSKEEISIRCDCRYESAETIATLTALKSTDKVSLKAHIAYYKGGLQLCGLSDIVVNGEGGSEETGYSLSYDFSSVTSSSDSITLDFVNTFGTGNTELVSSIDSASAYAGDSSQNTITGLKLGTNKKAGNIDFTLTSAVKGVKVTATGYKTYSSELLVNKTTYALTAQQSDEPEVCEFTFETETKTVSIGTSGNSDANGYKMYRAWIKKIEFVF